MAVSGSSGTASYTPVAAYVCQVHDWQLVISATTGLQPLCVAIDDALRMLAAGERCVVAGSDMAALRDRLRRAGVLS